MKITFSDDNNAQWDLNLCKKLNIWKDNPGQFVKCRSMRDDYTSWHTRNYARTHAQLYSNYLACLFACAAVLLNKVTRG